MKRSAIGLALLLDVFASGGFCAGSPKECVTVDLNSYGKLSVNPRLVEGGLARALLPGPTVDALNVVPPSNGILPGPIYIDGITLNWGESKADKPFCTVALYSPWVGQFFRCTTRIADRPLMLMVLMHGQGKDMNPEVAAVDIEDYVKKEFLSCP